MPKLLSIGLTVFWLMTAVNCNNANAQSPVAYSPSNSSPSGDNGNPALPVYSVGDVMHGMDTGSGDDAQEQPEWLTCRSFLFAWPCQDCDGLRLNLCDPLVTDRPDFTESSSTVGRGVTQFELGYTFITDEAAGTRTDAHSYPELLIRHGLFRDWFELRIGYNAASELDGVTNVSGSEDLYLGAKIGLTPQHHLLPEMAIIPQATLNTGSAAFTSGKNLFGANWIYSWEINDCLSLAGSTQFNRAVDEITAIQYTQWAQSIAVGASITDTLGAYC